LIIIVYPEAEGPREGGLQRDAILSASSTVL
jgi:hypothetical protein